MQNIYFCHMHETQSYIFSFSCNCYYQSFIKYGIENLLFGSGFTSSEARINSANIKKTF